MELTQRTLLDSNSQDILSRLIESTKQNLPEILSGLSFINEKEDSLFLNSALNEKNFGITEVIDNKGNQLINETRRSNSFKLS